jgi:hypothetical protein
MPGVTPPDVPPVSPAVQQAPAPQPGAIVTPSRTVTVERRAQTEMDSDPYIQRRIARTQAKSEYKANKREAKQEYKQAKREADEQFNSMRQAESTQSPRGELGSDYGSSGR